MSQNRQTNNTCDSQTMYLNTSISRCKTILLKIMLRSDIHKQCI